jgi:hypothetical protein
MCLPPCGKQPRMAQPGLRKETDIRRVREATGLFKTQLGNSLWTQDEDHLHAKEAVVPDDLGVWERSTQSRQFVTN